MRLSEILMEGRDAPLYHGMTIEKAISVFRSDSMPARWTHTIPGVGAVKGNSLSRNKHLRRGDILITLDQSKLSHNHKIYPLDAEVIFNRNTNNANDRQGIDQAGNIKTPKDTFAEEFVVGNINQLHMFIISIHITHPHGVDSLLSKNELMKLKDEAKYYARIHRIPITIDKGIKTRRY